MVLANRVFAETPEFQRVAVESYTDSPDQLHGGRRWRNLARPIVRQSDGKP
jgi:hypothetical protein